MINLPISENQHWALFRVLVMPPDLWTSPSQPWQILPFPPRWNIAGAGAGYHFLRSRRVALPDLGMAQFRYRFGRIDGRTYGIDSAGGALDLEHYSVRIQAAPAPSNDQVRAGFSESDLRWRTVWLGTVEYQQDIFAAGKDHLSGDRIYHCVDVLGLTKKWSMQNHVYDFGGAGLGLCRGHPGYNRRDGDGSLSGNRAGNALRPIDDAGETYAHTLAGQGNFWNDGDALTNALLTSRSAGSPVFDLDDPCDLLAGEEAWTVNDTERAWDFLTRMCPRQRGRGLVYAAWADDVDDPTGRIEPFLAVRPQSLDTITYNRPSDGAQVEIPGASDVASAISIDVEGDQRLVAGSFQLGGRSQHKVAYLETPGEQIEVVITVGYPDAERFEEKWPISSGVAFDALTYDQRRSEIFDLVYHLHGLPDDWRFNTGNGNGSGTNHVVDYHCVNGGIGETSSSVLPEASLATTEILGTLPIPTDPKPGTRFVRSPALLLMKVGEDLFLDGRRHLGLELRVREDGFHVSKGDWDDEGFRYVGDLAQASHQAAYSYQKLAFTFAIRLPHRIMYNTGDRETSGRRLVLPPAKDMRLALVSKDAITALDLENGDLSAGYAPIRDQVGTDGGSTFRILRDDRDRLARRHWLTWSWVGVARQTLSYQMKCCMLLPSFEVEDDRGERSEIEYPRLGQLVATVRAGGTEHQVHTPITGIGYDNEAQISQLETDWSELDLRTT